MQTNKESDPSVQRGFDEDYAGKELRGVDVFIWSLKKLLS